MAAVLTPLPLEHVLVRTDESQSTITQATEILTGRCMESAGFEYIPYPVAPLQSPLDPTRRYGHLLVVDAQRVGYGDPAPEQAQQLEARLAAVDAERARQGADYLTALWGSEPATSQSPAADPDGCRQTAELAIWGTPRGPSGISGYDAVVELQVTSNEELYAGPEGIDAVEDWAACMRVAGYDFDQWWEARQAYPTEYGTVHSPSNAERSQAVADARCRQRTELAERLASAEAMILAALMEDNGQLIREYQRNVDTALTRAIAVVEQ